MKQEIRLFSSLEELYRMIMIMLYSLTALFFVDEFLQMGMHRITIVILCVFFILLFLFYRNNKSQPILFYLTAGLVVFFLIVNWVAQFSLELFLKGMRKYLLAEPLRNKTEDAFYALILAFLLFLFLFSLFSILIKYRRWNLMITVILGVSMIIMVISEKKVHTSSIAFVLFLVEMNLIELIAKQPGKYYLLPFCLLAVMIPATFPMKQEPVKWDFVTKTASTLQQTMESWYLDLMYSLGKEDPNFSVSEIGYSRDAKLGGSIGSSNDKTWLRIKSDQNPFAYLTGSVYQEYTGRGWTIAKQDEDLKMEEYKLDYLELLYALSKSSLTEEEIRQVVNPTTWSITFIEIDTKSLFYPLKTYFIEGEQKETMFLTGSNLFFRKGYGKGTEYKVSFLSIPYEDEGFANILIQSDMINPKPEPVDYFDLENLYEQEKSKNSQMGSLYGKLEAKKTFADLSETLRKRQKKIEEEYTTLPASVPGRVFELTQEICRGTKSRLEQCRAITQYLRKYQYTTSVTRTAPEEDSVDHFLFESKTGYCTYFASAMAVMCRTQGIPARYVEGFACYQPDLTKRELEVKGVHAHAWCEVYFSGVGWVPFEATPSDYSVMLTLGNQKQEERNVNTAPQSFYHEKEELSQIEELKLQEQEMRARERFAKTMKSAFLIGVSFVLIGMVITTIAYCMQLDRRRNTYQKLSAKDKILAEVRQMSRILTLREIKMDGNLTSTELIALILASFKSDQRTDSIKLHQIFCRARYFDEEIEASEVIPFYEIRINMEKEYLENKRFFIRIKYRFFDAMNG